MLYRDIVSSRGVLSVRTGEADQSDRRMRLGIGELLFQRLEGSAQNVRLRRVQVVGHALQPSAVGRLEIDLNGLSNPGGFAIMKSFHELMILYHEYIVKLACGMVRGVLRGYPAMVFFLLTTPSYCAAALKTSGKRYLSLFTESDETMRHGAVALWRNADGQSSESRPHPGARPSPPPLRQRNRSRGRRISS